MLEQADCKELGMETSIGLVKSVIVGRDLSGVYRRNKCIILCRVMEWKMFFEEKYIVGNNKLIGDKAKKFVCLLSTRVTKNYTRGGFGIKF